jgi:hypothetical protein
MVNIFLISPLFLDYILPFVLVFTLIFAILQKTQILGDDKKQIDALIGMVVGLILIAFPFSRMIVVELMPFLAVTIVVLFVFMLIFAFVMGKKGDIFEGKEGLKWMLVTVAGLALITVFLMITGWWDGVWSWFFHRESSSQIWVNVLLLAVLVGAVVAVLKGDSGGSSSS